MGRNNHDYDGWWRQPAKHAVLAVAPNWVDVITGAVVRLSSSGIAAVIHLASSCHGGSRIGLSRGLLWLASWLGALARWWRWWAIR